MSDATERKGHPRAVGEVDPAVRGLPSWAIEVEAITKRFGSTEALAAVDLTVEAGTVLGLLGPNGAGKTTLVRILTTLLVPDSGRARVVGHDVVRDAFRVRSSIGLAGQHAAVDEMLTGRENLELVGRLYGLRRQGCRQRAEDVLIRLGLTDAADRLAKTYSGGMRRRLDLGATLVGRPSVLLLDEPTAGLDPRARTDLWRLIEQLVEDGTTVLLTSQYLEEVDRLADHIVVLDKGRVIAAGTPAELKRAVGGEHATLDDVFLTVTGHTATAEQPFDDPPLPARTTSAAQASSNEYRQRRALHDVLAVTKRDLLHNARLPQAWMFGALNPVLFVLMFYWVFGGAIQTPGFRFIDYLVPGTLVTTVLIAGGTTAIGITEDLKAGVVDRLRSLPMARSALLAGRTVADACRNVLGVALMIGVAMAVGFRFHARAVNVVGSFGLLLLFGYAVSWVGGSVGLAVKDSQAASVMAVGPPTFLTFTSSAIVPVGTMPGWLQAFPRNQPASVVVNAVRALMHGGPAFHWVWQAVLWSAALIAVFVPLTVRQYNRASV